MQKFLLLVALILTLATSAIAGTTLESVKKLSQDTTATTIYFPTSKESPEIFKVIAKLSKLEEVTINTNSLSAASLEELAKNPSITKLRFLGALSIRDAHLKSISKMTQLTSYRDNAE